MTAAVPPTISATGTHTIVVEPGGTARLGDLPVPLRLDGLVVDDQRRLVPADLPLRPDLPPASPPPPTRPGAMAFRRGRVYFTSADGASVLVRDCGGGITSFVGARDPYGPVPDLAALATTGRDTLLVADRAAATVREIDLATSQTVWSWRDLDGVDDVTVTADDEAYVTCDRGIVRLDPYARTTGVLPPRRNGSRSTSLAWGTVDGADVLFAVLGPRLVVVDLAADPPRECDTPAFADPVPVAPVAVRRHGDRLHLGSPAGRTIRVLHTATGSVLGDLPGPADAFAAFGLDADGALWVTDGVSAQRSAGTRSVGGSARIGPVTVGLDRATAHRLRIRLVGEPSGAGATVAAGFDPPGGPPPPGTTADSVLPVPPDATAVTLLVTLAPATRYAVTAVQLRVDEPGWIDQLPVIYRDPAGRPEEFLDPFLRLARAGLDEVVDALLALPGRIDPRTATDDLDGDRWLDWLAGWVDVPLDETMPGEGRRELVAGAFARHGTRGTADHLRAMIALELGLTDVEIVQPGDVASVWVLGADSSELGLRTMTAAAPPGGSVLDATAVVARSHLIGAVDNGAPLFGDLANRFYVLVHAALVRSPDERERLEALIERERPAHTAAHLCVVEPGISVGIQARIGVDTVIGINRHQHALGGFDGFTADTSRGHAVLGEGDREGLVLI